MKSSLLIIAAALLAMTMGCRTSYDVRLNSFLAEDRAITAEKPFYVRADPNFPNPILAREISRKIEYLLMAENYSVIEEIQPNSYILTYYFASDAYRDIQHVPVTFGAGFATGRPYSHLYYSPHSRYSPYVRTVYEPWMVFRVFDNEQDQEIWNGEATIRMFTSDYRESIDYLLAGLFSVFGEPTPRQIRVTIRETDPVIEQLRLQ